MKVNFYKIECITNLHVGSGDINYNIVDNEVEKDAVTGLPMIHASGIKGAIRDVLKKELDESKIKGIFGSAGDENKTEEGSHKFFDAHLLARPMRVAGSCTMASIPVMTVASVNQFIDLLSAFGGNEYARISGVEFGKNEFVTNASEEIRVEGEKTGKLSDIDESTLEMLKSIVGEEFAIAKSFDNYALPVMARNYLVNGESKNLWYEEVVPHESVLYFAIMGDSELELPEIIQFGGHSSIGCGFTKVTKI